MERTFSQAIGQVKTSAVRDILKLTQSSDVLSFAGGLPAEDAFPVEPIRAAYDRVLARGANMLQYGVTEGVLLLREWLAEFLRGKRIETSADRLLLTTGSQQGIDLIFRVMLDPGDRVLVERPTYLAALQALTLSRAEAVEVDSDEAGMRLDDLEAKLTRYRPKIVYVTPTFSNPAGKLWSLERRKGLVELARKHGALLIEDDPYGDIRFDEKLQVTSLYELDAACEGGDGSTGNVLHLGSFSKTVSPALRTGFAAGPGDVIRTMAKAKQASDLHSSSIDQMALFELMTGWDWRTHQRRISTMYRERMEGLTSLWKGTPWEELRWNQPMGGMFVWVMLPENMVASELLKIAVQEGVAFVPGDVFYAGEPARNAMRINFTHTPPTLVPEATARLARALQRYPQ
jgi:2-aminoadipate transaminase